MFSICLGELGTGSSFPVALIWGTWSSAPPVSSVLLGGAFSVIVIPCGIHAVLHLVGLVQDKFFYPSFSGRRPLWWYSYYSMMGLDLVPCPVGWRVSSVTLSIIAVGLT